jgi:RNA polymerase sigma factor (sigma-70 family)
LPSVATHAATARAARSDETARLYGKYGRQLYRYCLARLRLPEEAEDAVQNTFIRVHGALAKGVTPRFEAAWLYKIAHNVCLTRSEINVRRAHNEQPTDFSEVELAAPEASDALDGLEEALASMPKNLRDPILLREWQGLSYAEIAESLNTSVSAVETLIFRARRHLVATLRPALDFGLLYSTVRVLLARLRGFAATAKVAAGAAALVVGGAGVSTAVTIAGDNPSHRVPVVHAPAPSPMSATPRSPVLHPAAAPAVAVVHVTTARSVTSVTVAQTGASSTPAPAPAPTAPAPEPTTVPVAAPPAATPTISATPPPTPTATVPVATPVIPTVVELPSVTTPVLTTPGVTIEVPTVQLPTLPVTVSVPTLP